jgi:hypothetical protein
MNSFISLLKLSMVLAMSSVVFAQTTGNPSNPFKQLDEASALTSIRGLDGIRRDIKERLQKPTENAGEYLLIAELMKRVGDSRADEYYQKAIAADDTDPAYELFYADYLRNFRGPDRPLFPYAERHYLQAQKKLRHVDGQRDWDRETDRRVERGLVALHQEDGVPVINLQEGDVSRPLLLFSSINRFAQLTGDFDNVGDVRAFTSEALQASSSVNQNLSDDVLRKIIRVKSQGETLNRFRFRYNASPLVEFSYKYREIDRAQITDFRDPNKFNRVQVDEFGISVEKPLAVSHCFDLLLRGTYTRAKREGLIETVPRARENINQYEGRAALSRSVGPDKSIFETAYVFQDIDQVIANPARRNRQIVGAKFTYELLRFSLDSAYRKRFETRGIHFFAGVVDDRERFGTARLIKNDYFAGTSIRGAGTYEITIQPTVFTSRVDGVSNQLRNSQYRTNFNFLWRIKDDEKEPGLPEKLHWLNPAFIHLAIPFKHDVAIRGLDKFENYNIGIALNAKFFRTGSRRTTFLMSGGYQYQRFYKLDRSLNLLSFNLSMGF